MNNQQIHRMNWFAVACLFVSLMLALKAIMDFKKMWIEEDLLPSKGLTKYLFLHEYHPPLKNSNGDTKVYCFEGKEPGGSILLLGGTHPNEAAGFVTAYLMLENLSVSKGKIFIISGPSGVGKDTIIDGVIQILRNLKKGLPSHLSS